MNDDNKSIKCDVTSCEFNNTNDSYCTLDEIKVSTSCNGQCPNKQETICDSFKEKKK